MTDQEFANALAYDVLGLKPGASETEARQARLDLVRTFHPDIYKGDRAAADRKLAKINAAFDDVMADLRANGQAMSAQDRAWQKAARQAEIKRKAEAARRAAAEAYQAAQAAKAAAARAEAAKAQRATRFAAMPAAERHAHRAAEAGFATTRNMLRGDVKSKVTMMA